MLNVLHSAKELTLGFSLMIGRCSRWWWLSWSSLPRFQFQPRRAESQEYALALTSETVFIRVLITEEVGIRPGNTTREADTGVIKLKRLPLKSNQIMPLLSSLALSTLKRAEEVSTELNSWGGGAAPVFGFAFIIQEIKYEIKARRLLTD